MFSPAALFSGTLARMVPRRLPGRPTLLYAAYTLVLFFVFLLLTLPVGVVAERMVRDIGNEAGVGIDFRTVRLIPWDGVRFSDVRVGPEGEGEPWTGFERISVRPSLEAIFGGRFRRGNFHGEAYGGEFRGHADLRGNLVLDLQWEGLDLARYPVPARGFEGNLSGTVDGSLHLEGDAPLQALEGEARLELDGPSFLDGRVQGFKIPDLRFATGVAEVDLEGNRLVLRNVQLTGTELEIDLRGQIYVREPFSQSVLNATMTVRPVPGGPPEIENLIRLLAGNRPPRDGAYNFSVYGTLASPRAR